ncbi:MAG: glycosyltransferase family 2 protein [Proteobacteria bacterium]|nr:glycosyltransferase family 2 protein [Pseudomonadota bacterium]
MSQVGQIPDSLIDVILPIRPRPPRLEKVLQSLNSQDHQDWRLIALLDRDDGSNQSLIEQVVGDRPKIFVACDYSKQSFPEMLNNGLLKSTATYVARQDDDDISAPTRFRSQLVFFRENPGVQLVSGNAAVVNEAGQLLFRITQPENPVELCRSILSENIIPHSSVMFQRTAVVGIGGYDEQMRGCEDYDLWLRILSWSSIRSVNIEVVEVLQHEGGMSRQRLQTSVVHKLNSSRIAACRRLELPIRTGVKDSLLWSFKQLAPEWIRQIAK